MKKIIYILSIALAFVSCKKEVTKDYVTLSGTIINQNSDSLVVAQRGIIKTLKVNADGTFLDTLKVEAGSYILFDGVEQAKLYLKNGYDLKVSIDTKAFDETLKFTGNGSEANNYLAKKGLLSEKIVDYAGILKMDKLSFNKRIESNKEEFLTLLKTTKNLDSTFIKEEEKQVEIITKQLGMMYSEKEAILALKGKASPKFVDYENHAGGLTSLDDLKEKYVYIDLWATWCGPCKAEIPFLKKVEKEYHGKNIEFVSISIDRENAYETWRKMVTDKELTGIQLYAKGDKTFTEAYKVTGIPRFILIDPQGNIVSADAPRPSDSELIDLFKELSI
ncbi:hypothetical protein A8C32_02495 [Flavivirga aquatica]|uniref:Thioredoxin domain-containing protein n=1 Tax=Flavivirga aquatica TaxID=1849968 RepID=A0A1E5TAF4_9FLAO|nr:TlpA disulfide reductase family protein [Flavivirga aquatica]OEK08341.1 hypothetical protein A8C32_02495 [Flavivirga aquatica]